MKTLLTVIVALFGFIGISSAYNSTYNVKVGDQFTVYTTYHSYTNAVLWTYDWKIVEPVSYIGSATTSVTFRAIAASPSSGSLIQAVTYYYRDGTTSSGSNKDMDDWRVYVSDPGPTSVSVSPSSLSLDVDEGYWLSASVSPSSADQTVTWTTGDRTVATVSPSGYVQATGPGDTYITATTVNGKTAGCSVHVNRVLPTSISVSPSRIDVAIGETRQLSYSLTPSSASATVTWSCQPQGTATVNSSTGAVTGKAEGTAIVIATTSNGCSATSQVNVYKAVPTQIKLNTTSATLLVGDTQKLTYEVTPSYAIYSVQWASSKQTVATVSPSGVVTAVGAGTATITVTTDNGKQAACTVSVPPQPEAVSLSQQQLSIVMGRTEQLAYTLQPAGAVARSVAWASTDPAVCSVGQDGTLTARKPGQATVTATTDNGCVGACQVIVPMPLYQLFVWKKNGEKDGYLSTEHPEFRVEGDVVHFSTDRTSFTVGKDQLDKFTLEQVLPEHPTAVSLPATLLVGLHRQASLNAVLTPADAVTRLTWFNARPEVAAVGATGLVTALTPGETVVTVQTANGLRSSCLVTVPVPCYRFVVWTRDGRKAAYDFADKPELTVSGDLFTVASAKATVGYAATDILQFTLEDGSVAPPTPSADTNGDGAIDVADIATIISVMAGTADGGSATTADVNQDGIVDVADISTVISTMAGK